MAKAIRLTEERRDVIRRRVLKSVFEARDAELAAEKLHLGDAVYDSLYTGPVKQQMAAMPAGFLPETSALRVQFGEASDGYSYVNFSERRRVSDNHSRNTAARYDRGDAKTLTFYEIKKKGDAIEKERHELRSKITSLLASVNTVKKLNEVWPESVEFTGDMEQEVSNLPAIIPAELNTLIAAARA